VNRVARSPRLTVALLIPALLAAACSGGGDSKRTDTMESLAGSYVVPMYGELAGATASLQTSVEALCTAPSADALASAQQELRDARGTWKRTEAMRIGPDMTRRSAEKIDWPIDTSRIDELLASDEPPELTVEVIGTQMSSALRGLGAVEHVLFADGAAEAVQQPRTCDYLVSTATVAAGEAQAVNDAWHTDQGETPAFGDTFTGADDASTVDMVLDDLVNEALNLTERMTDLELRVVKGVDGPDAPPSDPIDVDLLASIHEGPAGLGVVDDLDRLQGLRIVFVDGLGPLLGTDLLDRVRGEIDAATAAFEALGDVPLREAAEQQTAQVRAAYDAVKALQITLSTDVVSKLGVTVGFSDSDGDSAG
jgi:predicted lipoprotein